MRTALLFSLSLLISLIILCTCDKIPAPVEDVDLVTSPDTLIMGASDTLAEFFLSTKPQVKVVFQISQKPDWLKVTPMAGILNGNILTIKVSPVRSALPTGRYTGSIGIISNIGGASKVYVDLTSVGKPLIKCTPAEISFPSEVSTKVLSIQNTGTDNLIWSVSNKPEWLEISEYSGSLPPSGQRNIQLTCNRSGKEPGNYSSQLIIQSNSTVPLQPVSVTMNVPVFYSLRIIPDIITFSYLEDEKYVNLQNNGNTSLTWSVQGAGYFSISPSNGSLNKGESVQIRINVDKSSFQSGDFFSDLVFSGSNNAKDTLKTIIKVYKDSKFMFDRNVIDAEFSPATNRIIIVSTSPNRLTVIDPDNRTMAGVSLNMPPKCLSVNKDGNKVAVGHNGYVTLIDLSAMQIEKEYTISCDALDIILTSSGWVYIFPVRDQWTKLRCLNLETSAETLLAGNFIYAGTIGRLHPSEKYIYGANNGVSPSDIEKYSIEGGTASYLYDSPYHGDYPMSGNIWFSENGERIFTRGKTVLRSSEEKSLDMVYNGAIVNTASLIKSLWHSGVSDKIFLTTQNYLYPDYSISTEVLVYNYSYLTYHTKYPLDKFAGSGSGGNLYSGEGHYVFANAPGNRLYILIKAPNAAGLLNEWALQVIEL